MTQDTAPAAETDYEDMDTTRLPTDRLGEMARQQALLDSDPRVLAPDGVDVDVWATLKEAEITDVRWEDGDLHVWMETTTHAQERIRRASRKQPAEYRNHDLDTHVTIMWGLDPEESPGVDIEVLDT